MVITIHKQDHKGGIHIHFISQNGLDFGGGKEGK